MLTCSCCGRVCDGEWVDLGIGHYEFWGQTGVDKNEQFVSDCCEAMVLDDGTEYIPDREDHDYDPAEEDDR
jgi:hypothetical protein